MEDSSSSSSSPLKREAFQGVEGAKLPPPIVTTPLPKEAPASSLMRKTQGYHALTHSPQLQAIPLSVPSLILDFMVAVTASLIFLLCFLMINDVNSLQVLPHIQTDLRTQVSLYFMYITIFIIYVVLTRSYFGAYIG